MLIKGIIFHKENNKSVVTLSQCIQQMTLHRNISIMLWLSLTTGGSASLIAIRRGCGEPDNEFAIVMCSLQVLMSIFLTITLLVRCFTIKFIFSQVIAFLNTIYCNYLICQYIKLIQNIIKIYFN